ncbi:MAG: hypothetical protein HQK52_12110 [Oligoflexia bacterium]|nr:hypothetical protein [Oligoflexia bacterium]
MEQEGSLHNHTFDGIIVSGIGAGALSKLQAQKIKVYRSVGHSAIKDIINAHKRGLLQEMGMESVCSHHHEYEEKK